MARLTSITSKEQLAPQDQAIADEVTKSRGGIQGPFTMLLHAPKLAHHLVNVGGYIRFEGSLDHRVRVLAAMVAAREFEAVYVWGAQTGSARRQGVPDSTIAAIRDNHSNGVPLHSVCSEVPRQTAECIARASMRIFATSCAAAPASAPKTAPKAGHQNTCFICQHSSLWKMSSGPARFSRTRFKVAAVRRAASRDRRGRRRARNARRRQPSGRDEGGQRLPGVPAVGALVARRRQSRPTPDESGPGNNLNTPASLLVFLPFSFLPDALAFRLWTAHRSGAYAGGSVDRARSGARADPFDHGRSLHLPAGYRVAAARTVDSAADAARHRRLIADRRNGTRSQVSCSASR